ncbi:MAG TPA: high-affinity branched-chain amino acid ABC transporter permease LivM [Stellaceae bacterium]|nr:high-affinity branched-chain amino acid ABC transporter permease LivM [Stellaceae bacterium]
MAVQSIAVTGRVDIPAIVKEAFLAAVVTFALSIPLVGFQTVDVMGGIDYVTHFDRVAYAVVSVFIGRLTLGWLKATRATTAGSGPSAASAAMARIAALASEYSLPIGAVGLLLAVAVPFTNNYYIDLGTTVMIYVMLGWGLNIVVGLAGLLDLGYVAFYAVGAYTVGLLSVNFGLGFWVCLPLAGFFAAGFGMLLGFPVLRLRGDYLAIVTLGFGEIIRIVLLNWQSLTNGPNGIGDIPRPSFFGLPFARSAPAGHETFAQFFGLDFDPNQRTTFLYYLILILALITNLFTMRIRRLPVGRAWEALREDEIACRAIGINATNVKLSAFAIGAMFAGFAGSFFGAKQGFISPESFNFTESATILAIVVLGGMGSQLGVVLAALILVGLPELGREFEQYRMLLFGAAMVGIMVFRPRGLLAHRTPSIRLYGKGAAS